MFPGIQTTVSALIAATTRFDTAARNIVNSQVESTPGKPGNSRSSFKSGYIPQRVIQTTTASGGVRTTVIPVSPASLAVFDPSSPVSNKKGIVDIPNVSLPVEMAQLQQASFAYKANAKLLKTLNNSFNDLLKI